MVGGWGGWARLRRGLRVGVEGERDLDALRLDASANYRKPAYDR